MSIVSKSDEELVAASVLCWLASVDEAGRPNVSPKEVFCLHDASKLLIANIASPKSARNVLTNPAVCVSMIDIFRQKGVKLTGQAELVTRNERRYAGFHAPLFELAGEHFPIISIFVVEIESCEPIVAPSYHLLPGISEASQIENACRTYGVKLRGK